MISSSGSTRKPGALIGRGPTRLSRYSRRSVDASRRFMRRLITRRIRPRLGTFINARKVSGGVPQELTSPDEIVLSSRMAHLTDLLEVGYKLLQSSLLHQFKICVILFL